MTPNFNLDDFPDAVRSEQIYMKGRNAALLTLFLWVSGCAMGYQTDSRFQNWLSQAEEHCTSRYGALPFDGSEARTQFENLSYQTYYNDLPLEVYADRLKILYPGHRLTVNCLASMFPRY
jgi:hypothetical protein